MRSRPFVLSVATGAALFACATGGRFAGSSPADPCADARAGRPPFTGADLARGEEIYVVECAQCHALSPDEGHAQGPPLDDIVSRRVGGREGFRYSEAFRKDRGDRGDTWTLDALDRYVEDPEWFVPGTRMNYAGLPDADDRRDLIAFLSCASGS